MDACNLPDCGWCSHGSKTESMRSASASSPDMVSSSGSDGSGPDTYAHPSPNRSAFDSDSHAVADANFGTDYARRGVYRDWGSTSRNPCLGRQWAADLGGYRQTRRGFSKPARTFVSTLFRQEV